MDNRDPKRWGTNQVPLRVSSKAATKYVENGDCWESTYSVGSHGYAQIGWEDDGIRFGTTAHRAAWVFHKGQIPIGKTVDHECKNRRCVRIDHLRLLENLDNARRQFGQDWPMDQCKHGHPHDEYWHVNASGGYCRACNKIWQARYRAKKKAAV